MAIVLKNADVIDCWLTASSKNKISATFKYVIQKIGTSNFNKKKLMKRVSFFNSEMKKFWKESKYNRKFFENKHSKWLSYIFFDVDDVSFIVLLH